MYSKVMGIITTLAFVILAWYIYAIYPFTMNLVFALVASTFSFVIIIVNYTILNKNQESQEVEKSLDIARIVFSGIAILAFSVFFGLSGKLGGSAAEDSYASWGYENYEEGLYYLSNHGRFTLVSYTTWIRMKILEQIIMPIFLLSIVWNFIHIAKTKGIKFMLTGKSEDIMEFGSMSSLKEKIGFIFLAIFVFSIVVMIMFALF